MNEIIHGGGCLRLKNTVRKINFKIKVKLNISQVYLIHFIISIYIE